MVGPAEEGRKPRSVGWPSLAGPPAGAQVEPQSALIVVPTTARFDSRTHRIAAGLAARGHQVTVLARSRSDPTEDLVVPAGYRIVRVVTADHGGGPARAGAAGRALAAIVAQRVQERGARSLAVRPDLIHAMAFLGLRIGLSAGRHLSAPVVYDARDLPFDARHLAAWPGPARRLLQGVERRWARQADGVVTVNDQLADLLAERWSIERPTVVMNGAVPLARPFDVRLQERLGQPAGTRVVLYHGGFSPARGIEQLIAAMTHVDRAVLVLMGYGPLDAQLRARAARECRGQVFVLDPVPPWQVVDVVAGADVVAIPIQGTTLNHRLATPNKLFEAMAAGVPVVASNLPGMASIIAATGCGLTCDPTDPEDIAATIRRLLEAPEEDRIAYRQRSLAAAQGAYGWAAQLERLTALYGSLTGRPW